MKPNWPQLKRRLLDGYAGLRSQLIRQWAAASKNDSLPNLIAKDPRAEEIDLIVIDDAFPHPLSAFRLQEYSSYLRHFDRIKIYSTAAAFAFFNDGRSFAQVLDEYENANPNFKGKTEMYDPDRPLKARLLYMIFLGNAYVFLEKIEREKIPFVFTMYPGGWFQINVPTCDAGIKAIFGSPYFRKVIVTQQLTYDYLVENRFCEPEQIEHIYGVVTPLEALERRVADKMHFGKDKPNLDICFVAHKYSEIGRDKGYDVFVEVAKRLVCERSNIYFHVVGGFDESVIDVSEIKDRIRFYGLQTSQWFEKFYRDKDIILSPNIPFQLLDGGAFDGFPTGCCTDAALHSVAIFCTDILNLNVRFMDREDIVIVPHDTAMIVEIVNYYYDRPDELRRIAENGCNKTRQVYSYENQIAPRIRVLEKVIETEVADARL
jgi:glycosyltransferase involved in cell wall biosynthesis